MENIFDRYRKVRSYLLETVHDLTTEQFNHIPAGFNNNIIWNIGHVIATQQSVCYVRAEKPLCVPDDLFNAYKPGTKPGKYEECIDIDNLKKLALKTIDKFEKDFLADEFFLYLPWTTRYGVTLSDIQTATEFLFYHEGIHMGYIMALRKCLRK